MSTHAYELLGEGKLLELPSDEALQRWKADDGTFWLDAGSIEPDALAPLLDELGVNDFLKTRCFRVGRSTIVLAVANTTFATFPVYADAARVRRVYGAAVCLPKLILTFRGEPAEEREQPLMRWDDLELDEATTSHLVVALMTRRAVVTAEVAREVRDELAALAERMDEATDSVDAADLEKLKRRISLLDAIAEEQREAFALFTHARSSGFDPSSVEAPLGLLTTMAAATERLVERNNARIDNLLRRVQDRKAELLNRRLGVLTIVSAIFMPLTLLAGIWGMNFEYMPELDDPNAYAWALSLMAALALGGTWIFYRRGWFD